MTATETTDRTWEIVKSIRQSVFVIIDEMVDNAIGRLDSCEGHALRFPIRGAGEWDWFWTLPKVEQSRLARRWFRETGVGPDMVADMMHAGTDVDAAMAEWLYLTRIVEIGSDLHRRKRGGYVPLAGILAGLDLNRLFPDTGYDLYSLFAAQPTCTEYVAGLNGEEEWSWNEDEALAILAAALEDA